MNKREIRTGVPFEIRGEDDGGVSVTGYAAVFGERTDIGGFFTEEIAQGAFTDAVGRDDVVFLINHDGLPLARTRSGTLSIKEDDHGLYIETKLDPNDSDSASIIGKMRRGDLDKMSFAFIAEKQEWDETGDIPHRTITQASLHDVSIVTFPAYDGTEIGLRCLKDHRNAKKCTNYSAAKRRVSKFHKLGDRKFKNVEEKLPC
jgi:HK97 family phage prohead protease